MPMRYRGLLYRALNPRWARSPLSGEGARRFGGRFNAIGTPALYLSRAVATAIREANRVGVLQPITLVAYQADVEPLFDATDPACLSAEGIEARSLADDGWRLEMRAHGIAAPQSIAGHLRQAGYVGMQVPSFAPGAGAQDINIVLWRWGPDRPARLTVVDDDNLLA